MSRDIRPQDIDRDKLARLLGRKSSSESRRSPEPKAELPSSPKPVAALPPTRDDDDASKVEPPTIWSLFCATALNGIRDAVAKNALVPMFVVENPFPYYSRSMCIELGRQPEQFAIFNWDEKQSAQRAAKDMAQLRQHDARVAVIVCNSRTAIPVEFRSLVREGGYFAITSPPIDALRQYADKWHDAQLDDPADTALLSRLLPQELLAVASLQGDDWRDAIRQLVSQRRHANTLGNAVDLNQLYGILAAKGWAKQLVSDIRQAREGIIDWDEVDHGTLLAGSPGTGKTTLARAIASAADATFISISPSRDWMTGDGLDEAITKVTATFTQARHLAPTVLFLDEIDTVGNRENFSGHNASWSTAFLNAILTEMDGFERHSGVIVIGATNYPDKVDPALRRAGRLDGMLTLELPDAAVLEQMLRAQLGKYANDVDDATMPKLARSMLGLSGADVEMLVRDARRRARADDNRAMTADDIQHAIYQLPTDAERRPIPEAELERTAIHEAGHAVAVLKLPSLKGRIGIATIAPGGTGMNGFVSALPVQGHQTQNNVLDSICLALAGRAAEELVYGEDNLGTGAGGPSPRCDLAQARHRAEAYVGAYGFSQTHPNWWDPAVKHSTEPQELIAKQYQRARALLEDNKILLDTIRAALLTHFTLAAEQLKELCHSCEATHD